MNNLRPTSVCDTTPLQLLESQSSSSEPSSPTLNVDSNAPLAATDTKVPATTATIVTMSTPNGATATTTMSLVNHKNHNNNNNPHCNSNSNGNSNSNSNGKIDIPRLNRFVNSGSNDKQKLHYHSTRRICCRILCDCAILTCVGLPILAFCRWGESYKRGFFCDDASLKHPYRDSTIRSWMLYFMCFLLPLAIIVVVEFFKSNNSKMLGFDNLTEDRFYFCGLEIPDWIVESYKKIGLLAFGDVVSQLTVEVAKYAIGRLRPHFLAVCQPLMYDGTTCDDAINVGRYIEDFTCQGLNVTPKLLKEVSLSFPSGHANVASFTMIYLAIYLQKRMKWQRYKMVKHLLQFALLMFAWYTCLTRVSDYKHHWTDVLAGSAIGSLTALIVTSTLW